jgi:hypothetical protein
MDDKASKHRTKKQTDRETDKKQETKETNKQTNKNKSKLKKNRQALTGFSPIFHLIVPTLERD